VDLQHFREVSSACYALGHRLFPFSSFQEGREAS